MSGRQASKYVIASLVAATFLGGCSSRGSGDWHMLLQVASRSWSESDDSVSLEAAEAIPYASLGFRIGSAPEQILVLATDSASDRLWTSAAHVAITTRNGLIVRTAGLQFNLSGYGGGGGKFPLQAASGARSWLADFADIGKFGVQITCSDKPVSHETIEILGKSIEATQIAEACVSSQLDWSFVNRYWVNSATGRVWRSIQFVHPNLGPIEIEILRPTEAP